MERIYKLTKAIKHGEEEITTITLREPSIDEILKIGYPYNLDPESGAVVHNPMVILKYLSALTALPPSTIKQLSISDFDALRWTVVGFFNKTPSTNEDAALSA